MNQTIESDEGGVGIAETLGLLPSILWRRRWIVAAAVVIGLAAGLIALLLIPTTYRSRAVLAVQGSQLSGDVVAAAVGDTVDQRVATIRQQIISRPDLIAIINQNGLYPKERQSTPLSAVIDKMRRNILLEPVINTAGGQSNQAAIAFALSFDYPDADAAQAVTQQLMEQTVKLYATRNATQANNTVEFLSQQAKTLETQIASVEGEIRSVSLRDGQALAGMANPVMPGGSSGIEAQIMQLQRENAGLIKQRSDSAGPVRDPMVSAAEQQLAANRAIFSDTHPDVILARQRLAEARALAAQRQPAGVDRSVEQQLAFNNAQIGSLRAAASREGSASAAMLNARARGPAAQQAIEQLQQRLLGLNQQYQSVSAKLLGASAGARANDQQIGERLSVIEPPVIPDKPNSINRWLIIAGSILGGLAAGLIFALALDMLNSPIRSVGKLLKISGQQPLGVIPMIKFDRKPPFRFRNLFRRTAKDLPDD